MRGLRQPRALVASPPEPDPEPQQPVAGPSTAVAPAAPVAPIVPAGPVGPTAPLDNNALMGLFFQLLSSPSGPNPAPAGPSTAPAAPEVSAPVVAPEVIEVADDPDLDDIDVMLEKNDEFPQNKVNSFEHIFQ